MFSRTGGLTVGLCDEAGRVLADTDNAITRLAPKARDHNAVLPASGNTQRDTAPAAGGAGQLSAGCWVDNGDDCRQLGAHGVEVVNPAPGRCPQHRVVSRGGLSAGLGKVQVKLPKAALGNAKASNGPVGFVQRKPIKRRGCRHDKRTKQSEAKGQ